MPREYASGMVGKPVPHDGDGIYPRGAEANVRITITFGSPMSTRAVHMIVRGMVQGVGFRFFVREKASRFAIDGWVRNLPDGSVEVYAEGDEEPLSGFIARIEEGPRFGHVSDVETDWPEPTHSFDGFEITF
jgi:acylphosphatase